MRERTPWAGGSLATLDDSDEYIRNSSVLRHLIHSGQLPVYRVGTLDVFRIRKADLDDLLVRVDPAQVILALRLAEEAEAEALADAESELPEDHQGFTGCTDVRRP